jgi:hypothetical protein
MLRIDHRSGKHDDRVIAVAMAVHLLASGPPAIFSDYMEQLKRDPAAVPDPVYEPLNVIGAEKEPEPAELLDAREYVPKVQSFIR